MRRHHLQIALILIVLGLNTVIFGQERRIPSPANRPGPVDTSMLKTGGHFLAWAPVVTRPAGFTDCLALGEIVLRGFQNIRRTTNEVTGVYGMNYASISCLGNTAYVMVAGSERSKTTEIRDVLMDRFSNSNILLPIASQSQSVNFLYFASTVTRVGRLENCRNIAFNALVAVLPDPRRMPNGASASNDTISAGIACQQTGSRISAMIIVSGKESKKVIEVRSFLARRMAETVIIDEGTELNPVDGD